jgi:hypothetical protein
MAEGLVPVLHRDSLNTLVILVACGSGSTKMLVFLWCLPKHEYSSATDP